MGNMETASSSPSGGSPTLAVSPSSSVLSPRDVHGMPIPPCHPAVSGSQQCPSTAPNPVSPTLAGGLTATRTRQMFEGHRRQLCQSMGSEVLQDSDCEDDHASRSGQPSPDGSLEACKRKDSVCLLSPPSSQPSLGCPHLAHAMRARGLEDSRSPAQLVRLVFQGPVRSGFGPQNSAIATATGCLIWVKVP